MSEHQILNLLQQMTMAANAYKTQTGISDRAITEFLVTGFSGQLKVWWDFHLSPEEQSNILDAIQIDKDSIPILNEIGNSIIVPFHLLFLLSPYILSVTLLISKTKTLNFFQTSNAKNLVIFNGTKPSF